MFSLLNCSAKLSIEKFAGVMGIVQERSQELKIIENKFSNGHQHNGSTQIMTTTH